MRRTLAAALAAALLLTGGACSKDSDDTRGSGKLEVVAGFYPLAEIAETIGRDDVTVTNVTPLGAEPHDIELAPRQVDRIEDADLVLYVGDDFQPAVQQAVERRDSEHDVDALDAVDESQRKPGDPHVWLNPAHMIRIADAVMNALIELEPDKRDAFVSRFEAYHAQLRQLETDMAEGLSTCKRRTIVTAHDAFHYLAARYDLEQEAIAGLSPEAEPTADRLSELTDIVRRTGATTVFTEELAPPKVAEALAREAGVKTAVLDPIEGTTEVGNALVHDYVTTMRENLAVLREALDCP